MDFLPPPTKSTEDSIRELTPGEIQEFVKPGYDKTGNTLPDPAISTFVGVFREGRVVASLGLQLKLHAQPLQIEPGHAAVLPALIKQTEAIILQKTGPQWVYLFAPAGHLAQIAQSMGMQLEPWCVLSKQVLPDMPKTAGAGLMVVPFDDDVNQPSGGDHELRTQ